MKISEIMTDDVITLTSDDTMAKALSIMYEKKINQIPIIDKYQKYQGMVFAKDFLNVSANSSSKLKNYVVKTPVLSPSDSIKRSTQLIVTTGNRALPVVEDSKLVGIISETDVILKTDFGNTPVDSVMAGAIVVIEDYSALDSALAKMRRYNISRLPVIDSNGYLIGVINALDRAKIMATPKERISKDSRTSSQKAAVRLVKVSDVMRKTIPVRVGTKLKDILEIFKEHDEIVVVGDKRKPIGIVTARDALEIILPRQDYPNISIANASDNEMRSTIEEHIKRFLNKIHGKHENVQSLIVYADKYKTRKYSLRAKIIFSSHVISAKAVGYDPLSASKKLISVLERRTKSERSKRTRSRQQQPSIRHPLS
jgi:CBS domain-containing protein/ribosome-associated translation inhibitor RaiA